MIALESRLHIIDQVISANQRTQGNKGRKGISLCTVPPVWFPDVTFDLGDWAPRKRQFLAQSVYILIKLRISNLEEMKLTMF